MWRVLQHRVTGEFLSMSIRTPLHSGIPVVLTCGRLLGESCITSSKDLRLTTIMNWRHATKHLYLDGIFNTLWRSSDYDFS